MPTVRISSTINVGKAIMFIRNTRGPRIEPVVPSITCRLQKINNHLPCSSDIYLSDFLRSQIIETYETPIKFSFAK